MARSGIKVSVIIPTYNRAHFLQNAVESVIWQGCGKIEVIIVDDRSTDNTESIVDALQKKHTKIIHFLKNDRAQGPSGARNAGILRASGQYIAFLDSDDIWLEDHLKRGVSFLDSHNEVDVLFANAKIIDKKTNEVFDFFNKKRLLHTLNATEAVSGIKMLRDNMLKALILENFFLLGSVILRRSSAENVLMDESIMLSEDRDYAITLYKKADAVFAYRDQTVLVQYRHDSNICNNASKQLRKSAIKRQAIKSHVYLFKKYLESYSLSADERGLLKSVIANKLSNLAYDYWIHKEYRNFWSSMMNSFSFCFTQTQAKNILKVIIYPVISSRYQGKDSAEIK